MNSAASRASARRSAHHPVWFFDGAVGGEDESHRATQAAHREVQFAAQAAAGAADGLGLRAAFGAASMLVGAHDGAIDD